MNPFKFLGVDRFTFLFFVSQLQVFIWILQIHFLCLWGGRVVIIMGDCTRSIISLVVFLTCLVIALVATVILLLIGRILVFFFLLLIPLFISSRLLIAVFIQSLIVDILTFMIGFIICLLLIILIYVIIASSSPVVIGLLFMLASFILFIDCLVFQFFMTLFSLLMLRVFFLTSHLFFLVFLLLLTGLNFLNMGVKVFPSEFQNINTILSFYHFIILLVKFFLLVMGAFYLIN